MKKAVGIDFIPNEVLKCYDVMLALYTLFNVYFEKGMIPSVVVSPIPHGAKNDPYTPLNYRGISLLSCVYKFILVSSTRGYLTTVNYLIFLLMNKMAFEEDIPARTMFLH